MLHQFGVSFDLKLDCSVITKVGVSLSQQQQQQQNTEIHLNKNSLKWETGKLRGLFHRRQSSVNLLAQELFV